MPADAAEVRQSREDPHRRGAKRDDAEHFDRVAGRPPRQEVVGQRALGGVNTLYASDLLDEEPKSRVHEVLIQLAAADAVGQNDLSQFTRDAGAESQRGSKQSLRKRK